MTQMSPKPSDQTNTRELAPPSSPTPQQKPNSVSVWRQIFPGWSNLSIRSKLSLLLVFGAAVPVIAVTQGMVWFSQQNAQKTLEETLHTRSTSLREDYILWYANESASQANSIAKALEAAKINLQNPQQVELNRPLLQFFISPTPLEKSRTDSYKSLKIITDAQGKTVEQNIQIHADYSVGNTPKSETILKPVSLPAGINLADLPIIKDALRTGRPLSGIELVEGKFLQKLGLDKQATVSLKPQPTQNLSLSEQPLPKGTYPEVDQGTTGLVSIAVEPIKFQGKVVGFALVGTLLNKHHSLLDTFKEYYDTPASIFAQDLRVSTTVPYGDGKNRAIGTRVSQEVAEVVLNQGKEFFGEANILGKKYLAGYSPLYDHQKQLNPKAKPVGMTFVGTTPETVEGTLGKLQLIGYSIGGGMLLLVGLVAIPIASTFSRPIRRLAGFAQQVAAGEKGVRLEATERQDEIGILTEELNQMAVSIEANLEIRRQEADQLRLIKDITVKLGQFPKTEAVFGTAVEEIRLALSVDRVVVYGFNEKWQGTIIYESVGEGWPRALGAKIDDPCFADRYVERYRQGRVQATENIYEAGLTKCHLKQLEPFGVKANLVAPIVLGSRRDLIGLLIAHQCSAPRAWQQSEIELFAQLATQVGFALDRANLLEQQKSAKEQFQKRALELLMEVDPVSRGDLTIRASVTEDEIGTIADSYNATIASLRQIVTQVQSAAKQVATTTSSSEVSVQELSTEALRQAQEIATALARIQEMSQSIRNVASSAELATVTVQQATQTVATGSQAMNRTVNGMLAIRETVAETSKKVKRLGESSQKISKVVNLIGTFADQTNLLALNAAIEAANAGEQGRGFAVVAERVRSLARQSTQAATEIEQLVADIQSETNEVVAAMEAGTEQVVTGTKLLDETRLSLSNIAQASTQINQLVEAIATAAVAQSEASCEVTQTMSDVAAIASKTSQEVSTVSNSFKELLALATQLQASASQFKVS